jgi:hypothetical protein
MGEKAVLPDMRGWSLEEWDALSPEERAVFLRSEEERALREKRKASFNSAV